MTSAAALFDAASRWPVAAVDTVTDGAALILAPHPDDESLGCGGLIAESCAQGQPPLLVVLTDGTGSHPNSRDYPPQRLRDLREAETVAAARCLGLGASRIAFLRLPDTAAPTHGLNFAAAVATVGRHIREAGCRSVVASWRHDPHCDHEAAALIAAAAAREAGIPHWSYPVWGRTLPPDTPVGAATGVRLDVTQWQAAKRRAVECHRSQWAGLITDDPTGFQMQPTFMALFDTAFELFMVAPQ